MVECTPIKYHVTDLFVHDPLSSSGYPMIIYTHPIADNLPIKTLVARQLQTITCTLVEYCITLALGDTTEDLVVSA